MDYYYFFHISQFEWISEQPNKREKPQKDMKVRALIPGVGALFRNMNKGNQKQWKHITRGQRTGQLHNRPNMTRSFNRYLVPVRFDSPLSDIASIPRACWWLKPLVLSKKYIIETTRNVIKVVRYYSCF